MASALHSSNTYIVIVFRNNIKSLDNPSLVNNPRCVVDVRCRCRLSETTASSMPPVWRSRTHPSRVLRRRLILFLPAVMAGTGRRWGRCQSMPQCRITSTHCEHSDDLVSQRPHDSWSTIHCRQIASSTKWELSALQSGSDRSTLGLVLPVTNLRERASSRPTNKIWSTSVRSGRRIDHSVVLLASGRATNLCAIFRSYSDLKMAVAEFESEL